MIYWWGHEIARSCRMDIKVTGNIPSEGGNLFLINHLSLLDIPVFQGFVSQSARFGAKVELFRIPFFGWAMKKHGVLPISRTQLKSVMKIYANANTRIKNGDSFVLAPEGTRQQTFDDLGPFKSGPFYLALQSKATIVPVVITGTERILPKGRLIFNLKKRTKVTIDILTPTKTTEYTEGEESLLKEKIRSQMNVEFQKRMISKSSLNS